MNWISQRNRWLPVLTLMPFLYFSGWLFVQPIRLFWNEIDNENLSLIGTLLTFTLFVFLLPGWAKVRWKSKKPLASLGILLVGNDSKNNIFIKGFSISLFLIAFVLMPLFLGKWVSNISSISQFELLNAIALGLGVGFAEELIFRVWLLEEMINLVGPRAGIIIQALIFSIAHIRFKLDLWELFPLLIGLFLLGLVLAIRRKIDGGSLWGCVGLHGGLVGIWFAINSGLIEFSKLTPSWLIGPGFPNPNPIGGLIAIILLLMIVLSHRKTLFSSARSLTSTFNA